MDIGIGARSRNVLRTIQFDILAKAIDAAKDERARDLLIRVSHHLRSFLDTALGVLERLVLLDWD